MGAVVCDLPSVNESDEPPSVQREDGSWLVEGALPIDEFKDIFHLDKLPGEGSGNFHALSGFVMMHMGRIPATADYFDLVGLRFEILDMDGHRIDKILVRQLSHADNSKSQTRS
jgi:putative hemolysin